MPPIIHPTPSLCPPDAAALLAWYDRHRRDLPWRASPGHHPDPYRVWLSEIMLQQTTVPTVVPYFLRFIARWPSVGVLAAASLDEVLHAWQGLGYYARARNLHACARVVMVRHGGRFPDDVAALRALPGIGDYTAAAIAAIAFNRRFAAVDGNVERVVARLNAVAAPLPEAKPRLKALAGALVPEARAGDFAQALMDLGATKPERPLRHGAAFWLRRPDGAVLLRRRPDQGLLGGMIELPSTAWRAAPWREAEALEAAPAAAEWSRLPGTVQHGFTHFRLELALFAGLTGAPVPGIWARPDEFADYALPTLTRKLVNYALSGTGDAARPNSSRASRTPPGP
jgi:A/G-specific adenine glycosylase